MVPQEVMNDMIGLLESVMSADCWSDGYRTTFYKQGGVWRLEAWPIVFEDDGDTDWADGAFDLLPLLLELNNRGVTLEGLEVNDVDSVEIAWTVNNERFALSIVLSPTEEHINADDSEFEDFGEQEPGGTSAIPTKGLLPGDLGGEFGSLFSTTEKLAMASAGLLPPNSPIYQPEVMAAGVADWLLLAGLDVPAEVVLSVSREDQMLALGWAIDATAQAAGEPVRADDPPEWLDKYFV